MGFLLPDTPLLSLDEYVRERDGGAGIEAARGARERRDDRGALGRRVARARGRRISGRPEVGVDPRGRGRRPGSGTSSRTGPRANREHSKTAR